MNLEELRDFKDLKRDIFHLLGALESYEQNVMCDPDKATRNIPQTRKAILHQFREVKESLEKVNEIFAGYNDLDAQVNFSDMEF